MSENFNDASANVVPTPEKPLDVSQEATVDSADSVLQAAETQSDDSNAGDEFELENFDLEPTFDDDVAETSAETSADAPSDAAPEPAESPTTLDGAAPDVPDESPDPTPEILASIRENRALIERIKEEFETKIKYDKTKEAQVERLYQENREYKNDLVWLLKKDLIADVVAEIDDVEKRLPYLREKAPTPENYAKLLVYVDEIAENFRLALERHDVYSYRSENGATFDPSRQRTLDVKTTGDNTLDRTTISVRRGFELDADGKKRLVRKELVYVYKYDEQRAASTEAAENAEVETSETLVSTVAEPAAPSETKSAPTPETPDNAETNDSTPTVETQPSETPELAAETKPKRKIWPFGK